MNVWRKKLKQKNKNIIKYQIIEMSKDYSFYASQSKSGAQSNIYNNTDIPISKYDSIFSKQQFNKNLKEMSAGGIPRVDAVPINLEDHYKTNKLSIQQEPNIKYTLRERYLYISSRDRNLDLYPQPQEMVINLAGSDDADVNSGTTGHFYKNVVSAELIGGTIPDQNNVRQQPFLLLHIDELENTFESSNLSGSKAFSIIQLDTPISTGEFINIKDNMSRKTKKYYSPPISKLSKLTIKLTDQLNAPFSFGNDTGGTPPNAEYQYSLVFCITEKVVDTSQFEFRGVF